jgi:uncharacterized protein YaaR (DUF327 family)
MKVTQSSNNTITSVGQQFNDDKRTAAGSAQDFRQSFQRAFDSNFAARIASIVEQITEQTQRFSKKIDIRELKNYKKLISEFLDEVVANSHKFTKENKLDRRGRHRVYALIKKINDELEDVTKQVLDDEKDNLAILQKLEDIRGLILDILT